MKHRERPQRKKGTAKYLGISKLHGWLEVDESARKKKEKEERREKTRRVMAQNYRKKSVFQE